MDSLARVAEFDGATSVQVRDIWLARFATEERTIAGVLSRDEFVPFHAASLRCPRFLVPVQRGSGLENYMWEVQNGVRLLFSTVESYKTGTPRVDLVVMLLTELLESHGVVLLLAQVTSSTLTKLEAAGMVRYARRAYAEPSWLAWVVKFNKSPHEFNVEKFLAECKPM